MGRQGKKKGASHKLTGVQYGALPWRLHDGELQILLVTSRHTRRWIIPKGWPMEGRKPSEGAAKEAKEEAGISGDIAKHATGHYIYNKVLRDGTEMPCHVDVFPLHVTKEAQNWDEMDARQRRWFNASDAADAVIEGQLRALIWRFVARFAEETRKNKDSSNDRRPA